jgi:hypothetical protein
MGLFNSGKLWKGRKEPFSLAKDKAERPWIKPNIWNQGLNKDKVKVRHKVFITFCLITFPDVAYPTLSVPLILLLSIYAYPLFLAVPPSPFISAPHPPLFMSFEVKMRWGAMRAGTNNGTQSEQILLLCLINNFIN